MNIPSHLQYLPSHEWVEVNGNIATVGISDYAQEQLGDVVYVDLPEVGRELSAGEASAVVESVKTASDIYSPVSGRVVEVNEVLDGNPEKVNESPYQEGWLYKVELTAVSGEVMDAAEYQDLIKHS